MCSYWLRTWRPHMYTPFAHAICTRHLHTPFAYAITKTPYAFFAKITLCMYLLYGWAFDWLHWVQGPITAFVYKPACEFWNELLNFATNFRTSQRSSECYSEKLSEIDCNIVSDSERYYVFVCFSLHYRLATFIVRNVCTTSLCLWYSLIS